MPALGTTRERVLTAIRTASAAPTIEQLAGDLELHPNSVRLHTTALLEAGLISQSSRAAEGPGRPQAVYRATADGSRAGSRNYEVLAEVLVDHLATTEADPVTAAREAGRRWGARLGATRPASDDVVPAVLHELGFEPSHGNATIELHNCPFRELVDSHQRLVCTLHAGMLEGLARRRREKVTLTPFTSPATCTVTLVRPDREEAD